MSVVDVLDVVDIFLSVILPFWSINVLYSSAQVSDNFYRFQLQLLSKNKSYTSKFR